MIKSILTLLMLGGILLSCGIPDPSFEEEEPTRLYIAAESDFSFKVEQDLLDSLQDTGATTQEINEYIKELIPKSSSSASKEVSSSMQFSSSKKLSSSSIESSSSALESNSSSVERSSSSKNAAAVLIDLSTTGMKIGVGTYYFIFYNAPSQWRMVIDCSGSYTNEGPAQMFVKGYGSASIFWSLYDYEVGVVYEFQVTTGEFYCHDQAGNVSQYYEKNWQNLQYP